MNISEILTKNLTANSLRQKYFVRNINKISPNEVKFTIKSNKNYSKKFKLQVNDSEIRLHYPGWICNFHPELLELDGTPESYKRELIIANIIPGIIYSLDKYGSLNGLTATIYTYIQEITIPSNQIY